MGSQSNLVPTFNFPFQTQKCKGIASHVPTNNMTQNLPQSGVVGSVECTFNGPWLKMDVIF